MSLPHFFLREQVLAFMSAPVFTLQLDADDMKHAKVLRLAAGEHIAVVDGASDYFECEVVSFDSGELSVSIAQKLSSHTRPEVVLVQGLAKGDKMDTIVRHATEVGIAEFVPMATSRSVVKLDAKKSKARFDRWASIAKSAAMQSGRSSKPVVHAPCSLAEAFDIVKDCDAVLICWEEAELSDTLAKAVSRCIGATGKDPRSLRIALVVGPEGGLTAQEVNHFLALPFAHSISLGPSILRTETAGIVAPALALYELEVRS